MNSLKNIISDYHSGLLETPNIQVISKKLSNETIEFPYDPSPDGIFMCDLTFSWSSFRKSELVDMEFINVNFESSSFEECLIKNCVFKNIIITDGEVENCVFENCEFIFCDLSDWYVEKTIFNNCKFLQSSWNKSIFDSCDFQSPRFESFDGVKNGFIGSAVLIDSKFSDSKKSIEFEGEVYFLNIFNQLNDELSLE